MVFLEESIVFLIPAKLDKNGGMNSLLKKCVI